MAKALKVAAVVVGVAALAVVTGGAALGLGVSLATTLTIGGAYISAGALLVGAAALTAGAALLTQKPTVTASQTERLTASIDPRAFRKTWLGQTAGPVDVRYEEWSGKDQEICDWIIALASHAIDGVEEVWFDTEMAWSATTGVVGKYVGYFSIPNLILEGSPQNAFTFASGKWNAGSARMTGCAYARFRFKVTGNSKKAESPFSSGIPSRITIIGRGAKLYDPRRDSTVPGGSGPMRSDDQSTWRYTADDGVVIGENLPLQILRVVLGWRIRNPITGVMKLATGSGVPARRISFPSFQIAANLADELVNRSAGGNEPRYHGAGVISESDDQKTVLDMLCAACSSRFRDTGGKLALVVSHNDLAAAAIDDGLNDDDVVGGFTWDPDPSHEATPNIVRGKYVDPTTASLYQLIDYPEVSLPSPDGQDRYLSLDLGVVESPSHAQRVAKQVLQRRQYARQFSAPFDIRAWKYAVGDAVPFTFAPLGFKRMLFRVKEQELGQGGTCNMLLTYETPDFYLWDASDLPPVQAADPIAYDNRNNPLILALADIEAAVTKIFSDDVITHGREKREIVLQRSELDARFQALDARYVALGMPAALEAARNAASTAYQQLVAAFAVLEPAWDDIDSDTPVDGAKLNTRWIVVRENMEIFAAAVAAYGADLAKDVRDDFDELQQQVVDAVSSVSAVIVDLQGIADDGRLTIDEKIRKLVPDNARLEAAWQLLDVQAAAVSQSAVVQARSSTSSARAAWISYLSTIDPRWNDTTVASDVSRSTFTNTLTNYATALTRLADALRQAAGLTALWDNVTGSGKDQVVSAAYNAATQAASALSQLIALLSDNVLDRGDKPRFKQMYAVIIDEQGALYAQAQRNGVDASAVQQRQSDLARYLGSLSPQWDDFSQDTPLPLPGGGETLNGYFRDYYTARTNLFAAIDGKINARVEMALVNAEKAASDGWLMPDEKRQAIIDRDELLGRMVRLVSKHDALGRPSDSIPERTAAGNAVYNGLIPYLNGLQPALTDNVNGTVIASSSWLAVWKAAIEEVNAFDAAMLGAVGLDVRAAVNSVADITFDGVWSPVEKRTVLIPQDQRMEATYGLLSGKASLLTGTSNVVAGALNLASNARANWYSFRSGRSPAWNDTSGPTSVNRAAALEVFAVYGQHLDGLAEALRAYTDTRATSALDRTNAMDSDGILAMGEKYRYVEIWQVTNAGFNALNQQYQINGYPQSVASAASNATAKLNSHAQLLGSLRPAWDNGNFDTVVNGPALRDSWIAVLSAMEVYSAALAGRSQSSTSTPTPTPTPSPTLPTIYFNNTAIPHGWVSQNTDITMDQGQTISLTFSIEVQNQVPDDSIVQMHILVGLPGQGYSGPISNSNNWIIGPSALGSNAFTATYTNYEARRTLSFAAHVLLTDAPQLVTTGNNNSYLRRNS